MAPTIKRERSVVPRLDQRRGGGGGGSSRSNQSQNGNGTNSNQNNQYPRPDWFYLSNADIMHYFRCNEVDLRILKAHLTDFMERNDYDGKPFPSIWEEDRDRRHFRALWNRMAAHSEEFSEMLSGARWEGDDEKPRDLPTKILSCKKKLTSPWKSAATKRRKAAEKKRLADEKEERREARREKKKQARRTAKAREMSGQAEDENYPAYGRSSPTPDYEERPYPAYGRTSPEPTYLEEGICPDFGRSTATPSTRRESIFSPRSRTNASRTSNSNSRSPIDDADSDIEEVDTPVKPKPIVIDVDDLPDIDEHPDIDNPILAPKKEIAEAMDLTGPEDVKPFTKPFFVKNDSKAIDLTGD